MATRKLGKAAHQYLEKLEQGIDVGPYRKPHVDYLYRRGFITITPMRGGMQRRYEIAEAGSQYLAAERNG